MAATTILTTLRNKLIELWLTRPPKSLVSRHFIRNPAGKHGMKTAGTGSVWISAADFGDLAA